MWLSLPAEDTLLMGLGADLRKPKTAKYLWVSGQSGPSQRELDSVPMAPIPMKAAPFLASTRKGLVPAPSQEVPVNREWSLPLLHQSSLFQPTPFGHPLRLWICSTVAS